MPSRDFGFADLEIGGFIKPICSELPQTSLRFLFLNWGFKAIILVPIVPSWFFLNTSELDCLIFL